jgi:serine/threonine protein kinase
MRLLEEYSVGQTLGEGAFGVVSNCKKRSTGEEFAVKMVDKVETPVDAIKKEASMLQSMDHPNIVKCHGVYYERCFVCIVMDKFAGGDLVEGLQRHLKEKGQIPAQSVIHVARQMGESIKYLHGRKCVHRDIKGDNYLMDRKDMTEPGCRIVLTDFGTVCNVEADERLSAAVGTKIFWSPEFFDKNYAQKVDVWAMGVIMYGLATGRFPFRDEADIRAKEVKIPKRVHPTCEEFIKKMLKKKEDERLDSVQVIAHPWVAVAGSAKDPPQVEKDDGEASGAPQNMRVDTANEGIKERRQELINRLNKEHQIKGQDPKAAPPVRGANSVAAEKDKKFTMIDRIGVKVVYEWWDQEKVTKAGLLDLEANLKNNKQHVKEESGDAKIFAQMLAEHRIDTAVFGKGKAKTVEQLAAEVNSGASRLMLDATEHKKLVRVVDVVALRLNSPISMGTGSDRRMLIETSEKFADGRERATVRLPGTKKEPHENTRQTAERVLKDMLKIKANCVKFDLTRIDRHEEEIESPSYPNVVTVYRKEIVEGTVISNDAGELAGVGLPTFADWKATDADGNTKFFEWYTDVQAEAKKVKLKPEGAEAVSTLVRAPIGLSEDALRLHLRSMGVDVTAFGQGTTKTLKEFSAELIRGESTLMQDQDAKIIRVVDVVVMMITRAATNEVLVQTEQVSPDGTRKVLDRLPGAKRRPDENQFLSARRILRRQLEIDENQVQLDQEVVNVEEEHASPNFPGLKTVYRKRIIKATWVGKTS